MYIFVHIYVYIYSKCSLTDHLRRSTTPLYRSFYLGPNRSPIVTFQLSKWTTSLNGPLKIGPMVDRFREVLPLCPPAFTYRPLPYIDNFIWIQADRPYNTT